MKSLIAVVAAGLLSAPAAAQNVKDIYGDVMPATATPAGKTGWQAMRLKVPGHNVDNMIYFAPDGVLRVEYTKSHKGVDGRWSRRSTQLCLDLPVRGSECFDYHALQAGETASVTSDRGWTGTVTMITDPTGTPLAQTG